MIVGVTGGREYADTAFAHKVLDALYEERPVEALVHGDAPGLDRIAGAWARSHGICEIKIPAQWEQHGSFAGPLRNAWILKFLQLDLLLVFPGDSGTRNMTLQALAAGLGDRMRYPK